MTTRTGMKRPPLEEYAICEERGHRWIGTMTAADRQHGLVDVKVCGWCGARQETREVPPEATEAAE